MEPAQNSSPRIGVWGTFDVANYGDLLFPRIFEHEITRRIPGAIVRPFSPLGDRHPIALSGGFTSEPLGPWTAERAAELADTLDFVAIGGGEIIHTRDDLYGHWYDVPEAELVGIKPSDYFIDGVGPDLEHRCPTAWHAVGIPFDFDSGEAARVCAALANRSYVSVRDEPSRGRLLRAGVDREVHVVPDSGFVLDRILTPALLAKRVAFLRAIEAYPSETRPLVVQGSVALLPFADAIGAALRHVLPQEGSPPVVLLDTGPCNGDAQFAEAVRPYLDEPVYRVSDGATVEDIAAAIAHSRGFVGLSLHGALTAFVYGLPSTVLNLVGYSKLDALTTLIDDEAVVPSPERLGAGIRRIAAGTRVNGRHPELAARVDAHFDALAELAELAVWERAAPLQMDAHDARDGLRSLREAQRRYEAMRRAHEARGRQLVEERLRFTESANDLKSRRQVGELEGRVGELEERLGHLERRLTAADARGAAAAAELAQRTAELESTRDALERLQATKLFRYTGGLRRVYSRLRRT